MVIVQRTKKNKPTVAKMFFFYFVQSSFDGLHVVAVLLLVLLFLLSLPRRLRLVSFFFFFVVTLLLRDGALELRRKNNAIASIKNDLCFVILSLCMQCACHGRDAGAGASCSSNPGPVVRGLVGKVFFVVIVT